MDVKTVLAIVSMVIAGVSAFYAYQISTQDSVNALTNRIFQIEQSLANFEGKPGPKGDQGPIGPRGPEGSSNGGQIVPDGAVVAFDGGGYETKSQSQAEQNGCPDGWIRYLQAEGRFVLGARPPFDGGSGGYALRDTGGAATHKLLINEMPAHAHGFEGERHDFRGNGPGDSNVWPDAPLALGDMNADDRDYVPRGRVLSSGGGQPHNNMPPYIALYFCKKVAE